MTQRHPPTRSPGTPTLASLSQIDSVTIEDVDRMARFDHSIVISVHMKLNMDVLLEKMWEFLGMVWLLRHAQCLSCVCVWVWRGYVGAGACT